MKKMIGGVLALLLVVSIGLVVAQNEEVSSFTSASVTPLVEALRELVGVQDKIADGVTLKGEYLINADGINNNPFSVTYKIMPEGNCDYAFYALRDDKLFTRNLTLDVAAWNGESYRDLTRQTKGTLVFDDDYYMVYLNMSYSNGPLGATVGYFEYSCN